MSSTDFTFLLLEILYLDSVAQILYGRLGRHISDNSVYIFCLVDIAVMFRGFVSAPH